jgi:uncharacterized membrane protein YhaH (DUF805 family)
MNGRTRVALHGGLSTFAAASALGGVFAGYGWVFPVLGAILVVVVLSELARMSPLPAAFGPILAAAGVTLYVTAIYASADAYARFIPTGASLNALADVARSGFHDVHKLTTPVPAHKGLVLLAVVGIAGVALVVDLLAVTMRRAALAGLPLLATFALCTSVAKHGVGWVPFVFGTAGYLWLLLADSRDRLSRWGRQAGADPQRPRFSWSDTEVMPSPLSVMGRRVGVSAIVLAVAVPLLIPGLRGGVPHGGNGLGLGGSSSTRFTVNPIVTIRGDLQEGKSQPVLTFRTSDPNPGYLRLTSLDRFDGTSFAPSTLKQPAESEVSRGLAVIAPKGAAQNATVAIGDLDVPWLPLPAQVTGVTVSGDWRYDAGTDTVFSARNNTQGLQYSVQFVPPRPTAAELEKVPDADSSLDRYRELPTIPASVRSLTQSVIANANTPFEKALAIQNYLTSGLFHYDLTVDIGDSTDALATFLLKTRSGFCQQFAAAMAVMARIADIPSRVAVGFTRGSEQPDKAWVVTTRDAHAWPELYFPGYGWLPFEPTPRGDGQAQPPSYTIATSTPPPGTSSGNGADGGGGAGGKRRNGLSKNERLDQLADLHGLSGVPAPVPTAHHSSARKTAALVIVILLGIALVTPSLARLALRRRRWRRAQTPGERASAAWAELRASAIDAHVDWIDGLTPRATARVLQVDAVAFDRTAVAALDRIVTAVQRAWYSRNTDAVGADQLADDVATVREAMFVRLSAPTRAARHLWPRSVIGEARVALGRITLILDAIDLAAARLRARLRPRHA